MYKQNKIRKKNLFQNLIKSLIQRINEFEKVVNDQFDITDNPEYPSSLYFWLPKEPSIDMLNSVSIMSRLYISKVSAVVNKVDEDYWHLCEIPNPYSKDQWLKAKVVK